MKTLKTDIPGRSKARAALVHPLLLLMVIATCLPVFGNALAASPQQEGDRSAEAATPPASENLPDDPSIPDEESPSDWEVAKATKRRSPISGPTIGGGKVVIAEDEYHAGELVVIGGSMDMLGEQFGEIVLIGAQARISGRVHGEVVAIASSVSVESGSRIDGSLVNVAGSLDLAEDVDIRADRVDISFPDLSYFATGGSIFWFLFWLIFWIKLVSTAFFLLAIIVVAALVPDRVQLGASVLAENWGRAFLFGLLACVGALICIIFLAVTVIGLPLAIMLGIAMKVIKWVGLAAIFLATGQQLGRSLLGRVPSYFAATLLGFLLFTVVDFVPIFGGILMLLLSITAVGLMLVTRLGTRIPGEPPEGVDSPPGRGGPGGVPASSEAGAGSMTGPESRTPTEGSLPRLGVEPADGEPDR